jgi:hypothetical protein
MKKRARRRAKTTRGRSRIPEHSGSPIGCRLLTLVHGGVLFLDEVPDVDRGVLETVLQPWKRRGATAPLRRRDRVVGAPNCSATASPVAGDQPVIWTVETAAPGRPRSPASVRGALTCLAGGRSRSATPSYASTAPLTGPS